MNIATVFTARVASRPDPLQSDARAESAPSIEGGRADEVHKRKATRAEFSALMALLANAGPQIRAELLAQVPSNGQSLVDKLLTDSSDAASTSDAEDITSSLVDLPNNADAERTTDAMRYGILNESHTDIAGERASASARAETAAVSPAAPRSASPIGATQRPESRGLDRALDRVPEHSHAREVLSRIVARNSGTVDQLKALGDSEAADVRVALDALLSHAGTPAGLELVNAAENGSLVAATATAIALANATSRSAADITTPVKDTDALAPELRQRLGRVIDRMNSEYGHNVSVVETARSQDRQDFLFEQGRTRPGAVVTWTRESAHTHGEAVDVIIDGKWNNAEGFARLQRIAKEEGLRTLGVRDPGHLELVSSNRVGANGTSQNPSDPSDPSRTVAPLVAAPASGVAHAAAVARVASTAGVARVAEPGNRRGVMQAPAAPSDHTDLKSADATSGTHALSALPENSQGRGNAFGRGERDEQGRPMNDGRKLGAIRRDAAGAVEGAAFLSPVVAPANGSTLAPATTGAAPAGAASAERVMDIQQMRDESPAGAVSRMTLNIDAPDGGQDRITIDVRGNTVGTQISTDTANAERLRMNTADLQDALGRHGLESDTVRITGVRNESTDARLVLGERENARIGAAQQSQQSESGTQHGQRERAATAREWERHDPSRQARDEQREQHEQQHNARQNASQRGRRETPNGSHT